MRPALLIAFSAATLSAATVQLDSGMISGVSGTSAEVQVLQGNSVCRATGRQPSLARAAARSSLGRRPKRGSIRSDRACNRRPRATSEHLRKCPKTASS